MDEFTYKFMTDNFNLLRKEIQEVKVELKGAKDDIKGLTEFKFRFMGAATILGAGGGVMVLLLKWMISQS